MEKVYRKSALKTGAVSLFDLGKQRKTTNAWKKLEICTYI